MESGKGSELFANTFASCSPPGESERPSAPHQTQPSVSDLKALMTANCSKEPHLPKPDYSDTTEAPQPATMPFPQNPPRMAALDDAPFISSQTTTSPELVSEGPSLHHGYDWT